MPNRKSFLALLGDAVYLRLVALLVALPVVAALCVGGAAHLASEPGKWSIPALAALCVLAALALIAGVSIGVAATLTGTQAISWRQLPWRCLAAGSGLMIALAVLVVAALPLALMLLHLTGFAETLTFALIGLGAAWLLLLSPAAVDAGPVRAIWALRRVARHEAVRVTKQLLLLAAAAGALSRLAALHLGTGPAVGFAALTLNAAAIGLALVWQSAARKAAVFDLQTIQRRLAGIAFLRESADAFLDWLTVEETLPSTRPAASPGDISRRELLDALARRPLSRLESLDRRAGARSAHRP